jgi:porin
MSHAALVGLLMASALGPCAAGEPRVVDGFAYESGHHESDATLELAYTADYWSAISGGIGRHDRVIGNMDLVLPADLDHRFGLARTRALIHVIYNNGSSFSEDVTGDLQVISNIETGTRMVRPLQAWMEHRGVRNDWSILAGLYDVNSEFDSLDASRVFLSGAHGMGTDIAQSGRNGPSIFPITSLGIRFARTLSPSTVLRIAVLDGVPDDAENLQRSTININAQEGAFSIAELDFTGESIRLLGGAWGYSSTLPDVRQELGPHYGKHRSMGVYIRGETLPGDDTGSGAKAFFRAGVASDRTNAFDRFGSVGLSWAGVYASRPDDEAGVAILWAGSGRPQRELMRHQGVNVAASEWAAELTYKFAAADWLVIQPSVQFIFNPGLDGNAQNILAAGLRVVVAYAR